MEYSTFFIMFLVLSSSFHRQIWWLHQPRRPSVILFTSPYFPISRTICFSQWNYFCLQYYSPSILTSLHRYFLMAENICSKSLTSLSIASTQSLTSETFHSLIINSLFQFSTQFKNFRISFSGSLIVKSAAHQKMLRSDVWI